MNKKFSTLLTMGLLATSSLCGSAWAQVTINGIDLEKATDPNGSTVKTWAAGPYFVVVDNGDGSLGAGDILLKVTYNEVTEELEYEGKTLTTGDNTLDLGEVSWFLNEAVQTNPAGDKTYSYTLKNVGLETFVTFDENGTIIDDPNKSSHKVDAANSIYQYATFEAGTNAAGSYADQFTMAANKNLFLHPTNASAIDKGLKIDATGVTLDASAVSYTHLTLPTT